MSKSAFTIKAFSSYVMIIGLGMIIAPNLLLSVFDMRQDPDIWVRVVGILTFNMGIYYWYAAKCEARAFFMASVYTRSLVLVAFIVFALLGIASPVFILFGFVDFAGGIWTFLALRAERSQ